MNAVRTARDLLAEARARLPGEEAASEAGVLLGHVLGRDRAWLVAHADALVDGPAQARFAALVERRAGGEPLAYLVGRRGFWSLDLAVGPDVLIPRADTETLVEVALRHVPQGEQMDIADLGTGSGAIALALARERPRARVLATDASAAALAVAQANARRLELANVEFARGDWCAALGGRRFELIVSNPPYIAAGDPHLAQGDLRFEPRSALESGADGLDAIRAIARCAPAHLCAGGWLLLEHGMDQGDAVRVLLAERGFEAVFTARDLEQRERVSGGRLGGGAADAGRAA